MRRIAAKFLLPFVIATLVFVVALSYEFSTSSDLAVVKVRAAEFLLVQHNGPRWGARPASSDIVLLLYDVQTVNALGKIRSYDDDALLYRQLAAAGAAIVYDTRNAAAAEASELERLRPLLDTLVELNDAGSRQPQPQKFFLDAWLSTQIVDEDLSRYAAVSASNPLASHPHSVAAARARLFPLAYVSAFGLQESAPLKILRQWRKLPPIDSQTLNVELARCGVMTEWHRQYPDQTALIEEPPLHFRLFTSNPDSGDAGVAQLPTDEIPWLPFLSTSILVLPAAYWISHDPLVSDYRRLSFIDVLQSEDPSQLDLAGKIVIVGYAPPTDPSSDTYDLPSNVGKSCPAEIIALATQTLLDRRWMQVVPDWLRVTSLALVCYLLTFLTAWLKPFPALASSTLLLIAYLAIAVMTYRFGWWIEFLTTPVAGAACAILGGTLHAWRNHRAHSRVVDMFGRYVPRAVVNQLMLQPKLEALRLGGTKRQVSVLFADIRGFTSFSEKMPPDQVVQELNSLLKIMVDCTFAHQGTLDKFIGDAILVLFNAPLDQPDHAERAVGMAIDLQKRLIDHASNLKVGIGVHVGDAVVGNIGTPQRMEYTAIGNTVNIAARLCDTARAGDVIVSADMMHTLGKQFRFTTLGPVKVKGIAQPIEVGAVDLSGPSDLSRPDDKELPSR